MTLASTSLEPVLPRPKGPVSAAVLERLRRDPTRQAGGIDAALDAAEGADPYGIDLQLAVGVCYELHYRGFAGVDSRWEWSPELLRLRGSLEDTFLAAVRSDVGDIAPDATASAEMDALSVESIAGEGPSYFLRDHGRWEQMREYLVHRSLYHLKEADPHAWLIPRLTGQAKA
jgi:hypothetical protein